ncbi:hypothetical protein D0962_21895 [Leptolyngbyaceae cyanobacterium CCMR0082]|uniref:DUF6916 domain-containing protein n=2 Tax=Adonisia turfae TaxID=2950184 RepID=A0A6M0SBN3_9CYAN|nr:hypothetical protein [Adonisia turfae]MDV3348304.1 hypothetical protein [Leptothoe sp. LEGE 181152]NEZ56953.1 hypothetical protein [Adonisia turfae CCMR0081]NEZ65391.1 hypothetical protein [Adonisia turfae CCMR0082]
MFKTLTLSDFSSTVGSSFQVCPEPDTSLQLELLEAVELSSSSSARSESFSLLFKGPSDVVLPQKLYSMNHSDLGDLSIFLVPVAGASDGIRYEAIFN